MSKYRQQVNKSAFGGGMTPQEADSAIFTTQPELILDKRIVAKPTVIFDIVPDPAQPRRAVPSAVRNSAPLTGGARGFAEMFDQWGGLAFREGAGHAARDVNQAHALYKALVMGEVDDQWPDKPGPMENSFLAVVALAASIRRDGLTNPVTVTPASSGYMILTGERRWLAYNLLYLYEGEAWLKIPAREVERNVWAQADENNQRSDLNAISRARQYAILLMDLLAQGGEHFRPFEAFRHEQDFYAQVADAGRYRVPKGKNDVIASAMGIKRQTMNDYRRLLDLPHEYWEQGDDENWSKNDLLQIVIVRSADNNDQHYDEGIVHPVNNSAADPGRDLSEYWDGVKENPPPASSPPVSQISQTPSPSRPAPSASSTPPAGKPAPQSAPTPPARLPWWGVGKTVVNIDKKTVGQVIQILNSSQVRVNTGRAAHNYFRTDLRPYDHFIGIVDMVYQWQSTNRAWCPKGMTTGSEQELIDLVALGWLETALMRVSPTGPLVPHYGTTATGCQQLGVPPITAAAPEPEPPVEETKTAATILVSSEHSDAIINNTYALLQMANQVDNLTPDQFAQLYALADSHIDFCAWLKLRAQEIEGGA